MGRKSGTAVAAETVTTGDSGKVEGAVLPREVAKIADLKPHPKNPRSHPDEEIDHLMQSISQFGVFRNVVIACEGTVLAGHGVVEAARRLGIEELPVVRLAYEPDDPRSLKVMTLDNAVSHLAIYDDRALTELLRYIRDEAPGGLLGTGYDDAMLAALVMVTRPASEIAGFDAAAEWVGMPEFDSSHRDVILVLQFRSREDRDALVQQLGLEHVRKSAKKDGHTWSSWWPDKRSARTWHRSRSKRVLLSRSPSQR